MRALVALLALLALAAGLAAAGAALAQAPPEPPPGPPDRGQAAAPADAADPDDEDVAIIGTEPRTLVPRMGRVLGGEFDAGELPSRVAAAGERQAAALRWLDEVFAPLAAPECAPVLRAGRIPAAAAPVAGFAIAVDRPVAAPPTGAPLLVPEALAPLRGPEIEWFRRTGETPFEVALAGEYARALAARHAGPAPQDGLLRLARAARLEGTARLAGIAIALRAANVDVADVGAAALGADDEKAGLPRALTGAAAGDPVRAALVQVFHEDGLRWALYQYLRGGFSAVAAALERPAAGLETLLRPGMVRRTPPPPAGCALGARASAALLTGRADEGWADSLVADRWTAGPGGALHAWLAFEDAHAAGLAADRKPNEALTRC